MPNREQNYLFLNANLEGIAPVGSPLRSLNDLVDTLDTREMEKKYNFETVQGNQPNHPKTMIKVALWAIHNCRFSLRKMEDDTASNLGYMWLTGGQKIDHSTMGKFLAGNPVEISSLFSQVVMISEEKELIDFELLAVDTVKIRANASYKQFRDMKGLAKEQEKVKGRLRELMKKAVEEQSELEKEERRILERRKERLEEAKKELGKREKGRQAAEMRINMTDFDCQMVKQGNGEKNPGYAITTATDVKNDIITGIKIDEKSSDAQNLFPTLEESAKNSGESHDVVVADPGFSSMANLEQMVDSGQTALIPDKRMEVEKQEETSKGRFDRSKFDYDEKKDQYRCPEKAKLGNIGAVEQGERTYNRYGNHAACATCNSRKECTKAAYRVINRDINERLKEEMRKELEKEKNKETYKKRAHASESPFGQVKHNLKYRIFMRRGKEKIGMEISLLCMLHNLMKIAKLEPVYMTG